MGQEGWEKSFASAVKKASAANRPIFVDFYADWCGPCKKLEQSFADPKVKGLLQRATCLRIDVDRNPDDAARFRVGSIPRLLLLSADGKRVLWDATGYRDGAMLSEELAEAMKVKLADVRAIPPKPAHPALAKVEVALAKGSFAALRASEPAVAQQGLRLLVLKLGVFNEADFKPTAALLEKAGRDALPALVEGMAHKSLAVRVGAAKIALATLEKEEAQTLPFDPWAPTKTRTLQLVNWQRRFAAK